MSKGKRPKGKSRGKPVGPIDYSKYVRSSWWRHRRKKAIRDAGGHCQFCGSAVGLEVHHKNYSRLYGEAKADLSVLCKECHGREHELDIRSKEHVRAIVRGKA